MSIQLIASDLDGTFLNNDSKINESLFLSTSKKMQEKNIHFVVATGRQLSHIQRFFKAIPTNLFDIVADNGGLVQTSNGEVLRDASIEKIAVDLLFDFVQQLEHKPLMIAFTNSNNAFIPEYLAESSKMNIRIPFPNSSIVNSKNQINQPIKKVVSRWYDNKHLEIFVNQINQHPTLKKFVHATSSGFGTLDVIPLGVDKATSLQLLSEHYSINPKNMAAFGDGGNDVEMLHYVGHPYVMPNAPETIKKLDMPLAKADNNNDGVLKTIDRLIKNSES